MANLKTLQATFAKSAPIPALNALKAKLRAPALAQPAKTAITSTLRTFARNVIIQIECALLAKALVNRASEEQQIVHHAQGLFFSMIILVSQSALMVFGQISYLVNARNALHHARNVIIQQLNV